MKSYLKYDRYILPNKDVDKLNLLKDLETCNFGYISNKVLYCAYLIPNA